MPFSSSDGWQLLRGRLSFTGAAGFGAQGLHTIATVTGQVEIKFPMVYCSEALAGALATIDLGVTGLETQFFGANVATDVALGDWIPAGGDQPTIADYGGTSGTERYALSANIILDVDSADITNGQLDFFVWFRLLSAGASLTLGPNLVAT